MKLKFICENENIELREELKLHVSRRLYKNIRSRDTIIYVNDLPLEGYKLINKGDIIELEYESDKEINWSIYESSINIISETENYLIVNRLGHKGTLNQYILAEMIEFKLVEMLKNMKNEINNLTNREISYIIITGGLSELAGFVYLVDEQFGAMAKVCNISTMGLRHNKYSSVYGVVKYFDDKLALRGKSYNMIDSEEFDDLISSQQKMINNDNIIGKVLGHFFDS